MSNKLCQESSVYLQILYYSIHHVSDLVTLGQPEDLKQNKMKADCNLDTFNSSLRICFMNLKKLKKLKESCTISERHKLVYAILVDRIVQENSKETLVQFAKTKLTPNGISSNKSCLNMKITTTVCCLATLN